MTLQFLFAVPAIGIGIGVFEVALLLVDIITTYEYYELYIYHCIIFVTGYNLQLTVL